jgi:hypothetical protein
VKPGLKKNNLTFTLTRRVHLSLAREREAREQAPRVDPTKEICLSRLGTVPGNIKEGT